VEYHRYLGERVSVGGQIVDTAPITIVAETTTGHHVRLTITDLSTPVTRHRELLVYGIAKPGHTVRAIRGFTVAPSASVYAVTVSFFAGIWVLARIVRHWRIDPTDWTLVPRSESTFEPRLGEGRDTDRRRE
jgi:hypothetical protein